MQIKTVSFLSGKILIGKVQDNGHWQDALFVTIVSHPETGERTAFFSPAAPGRLNQNLSREEFLAMINGQSLVGPSFAAPGLAKAYETFLEDPEALVRCVLAHTTECGPSDAFVGTLPDHPKSVRVEKEDTLIKLDFKP